MSINKEHLKINRMIEQRMKQILVVGVGIGLVLGILLTSLLGVIFGKDKEDSSGKKPQETKQEALADGTGAQVVDAVEVAKLNAKTLSSKKEDWKLTLVNASYPLDPDYRPELVDIEQDKQVDARIAEDLNQMLSDAREEGLNPFICSAYRDYEYQRSVFNDTMVTWINNGYTPLNAYEETAKSVAVPGTSEHATGLALDITSAEFAELDERQAETAEAKWLAENCWKYGFILRYPPDKSEITGIIYEPWHYRYVGKEAAEEITKQGVTLEEYLNK